MKTRVTTDTARLNRLINRIPGNRKTAIKAVGFRVEALAKMKAPVDLGNLRNSIYVRTNEDNPIPSEATEELPRPSTDDSVYIGPSVEHGIYQELGTNIMDAQPYMLPALREVESELEQSFGVLVNE